MVEVWDKPCPKKRLGKVIKQIRRNGFKIAVRG
jgi:hypothetical protein